VVNKSVESRELFMDSCASTHDNCPGERPLDLPQIDQADAVSCARIHKALSDETRLMILAYLESGELCVCELLEALKKPQPTVSHHLMILQNAGFIKSRKLGRWVMYSLNYELYDTCGPVLTAEKKERDIAGR
jgi:DNA-binding transcriptional ArsR family regulator